VFSLRESGSNGGRRGSSGSKGVAMESKLAGGLYFAGEIFGVDGRIGGFIFNGLEHRRGCRGSIRRKSFVVINHR